MFIYTNSYLETSISTQKSSEKDEKHPPKIIPARQQDQRSNEVDFLQSITEKVEPMDMDAILKEGLEYLDNNPQPAPTTPSINPKLKQSPNKHNRSAEQANKAAKHSPSPFGNQAAKQSKSQFEEDGQSPLQRQGMKEEMMNLGMKLKSIQRKNDYLAKENSELRLKTKTLHVKIEEQFQDLFTFQIQGLKAELNFQKEKSDSQKSQYQRKIKDYEKKMKKLDSTKKKQKGLQNNTEQSKDSPLSNKEKDMTLKAEQLEGQNRKIKREMLEYQGKLKETSAQKLHLERQLSKKKEEADAQSRKNAKQYQQLTKKYESADSQRKQLIKNMKKKQEELQIKNDNLQILKKKLEEDIQTLKVIRQEMKQQQSQIKELKKEQIEKAEEMDRLQTELEDHKQQNKQLHFFKKMVMNHLTSITQQIRLPPPSKNITSQYFVQLQQQLINIRFFQDSVILRGKSLEKKLFLVQALSGFLYCSSFDVQLLYRFDPLNTANFHEYIDRRPNLLLILQLANGTIIAGFSVSPIDPSKAEKPGEGILMSVTDQKVYSMRLQPKQPVVTYDIYYYILGNSEIRLKTQQKKVYSNFGIPNSTFDNGRDERNDFLKTSERSNSELQVATYEFYQIRDIQ